MSPAARDALGLAASYAFVFGFIGAATLLMKRKAMPASATRKVIHIGVAHWWLLAMVMMDDPWVASAGPVTVAPPSVTASVTHAGEPAGWTVTERVLGGWSMRKNDTARRVPRRTL